MSYDKLIFVIKHNFWDEIKWKTVFVTSNNMNSILNKEFRLNLY